MLKEIVCNCCIIILIGIFCLLDFFLIYKYLWNIFWFLIYINFVYWNFLNISKMILFLFIFIKVEDMFLIFWYVLVYDCKLLLW